jgi:hypothetical protein
LAGGELRVTLPGGTLGVVRAERHEAHGARLRAAYWRAERMSRETSA